MEGFDRVQIIENCTEKCARCTGCWARHSRNFIQYIVPCGRNPGFVISELCFEARFRYLNIFSDHGRMTDGHGRTVDFKNTIIIMTSNVGSRWIQEQIGDIVDIQMKRLKSRLAEMNMDLVLSEDARAFLAERDLTRYTVPVQ